MAAPKRRVIPRDPYMHKVVNLVGMDGTVKFRGTRRDCVQFARIEYEEKLEARSRSAYY